MSNIEHLLENGLSAVDKAFEKQDDCYLAFQEAMDRKHNKQMLESVNITKDELWQIIQYIKFCRETLKGGER